jgi:16S rRNA (cytidine1402-2'-O)-methyltransferase
LSPAGTLYLLPAALGPSPWQATLAPQAREIACTLDYFVVENARSARAELKRIGHPRPLQQIEVVALPERAGTADLDRLLEPLAGGRSAGLLSEAGCPAVADPGSALVARAHERALPVVPLAGASSLLLALMASGLNGQSFAFHGYLPVRDPQRRQRILELEAESRRLGRTQIFIETPYRNAALFAALATHCAPATRLCLATELTLAQERVATRSIGAWREAPAPDLERRPTVFLLLA